MIRRILLTLVILISTASADPRYYGIDQLGGAKYAKTIAESHPDGFALGIFTQKEIFGDGYPVVDAALSKRRIPLVRYNLRWSDTHTFRKGDFPAIVAEARRGLYVVNKFPGVECQFSGATEHQLNALDAADLAQRVLAVIPERCVYVNNPWLGKGAFIPPGPRIINEVHGDAAQKPKTGGRYNFSFDGTDAFDANVTALKSRFSDADVFFIWTSQNNGRSGRNDATPRPQRKFWPTSDLMRMQAFLATDQGAVKLQPHSVVKPKADQHMVPPEPRALKPVVIIPQRVDRLSLVGDNGKLIAVSGKPEPFADGRWRYYFQEFGDLIAKKAIKLTGKPTGRLMAGKKQIGVVNMGFRQ